MISMPTEPIYRTCYLYDSSTGKLGLGKYNYTEMLEKMKTSAPPEGITYWGEPDEYGRVYVDPKHPSIGTLEPAGPADYSNISLPGPGSASLPSAESSRAVEKGKAKDEEERKAREEQLRLYREEREQTALQEALLHRIARSVLSAQRG